MRKFTGEKELIYKAAKGGDWKTSLRSAFLMVWELGDLCVKQRGLKRRWWGGDGENRGMGGKVIGGRGKDEVIGVLRRCVRATYFCVFKMKALS